MPIFVWLNFAWPNSVSPNRPSGCLRYGQALTLFVLYICLAAIAPLSFPILAAAQTSPARIVKFDVPGAILTLPISISSAGVVTGLCDDGSMQHGFARDAMGNITTFDPVGSVLTQPAAINRAGQVVGFWADSKPHYHGFIRNAD